MYLGESVGSVSDCVDQVRDIRQATLGSERRARVQNRREALVLEHAPERESGREWIKGFDFWESNLKN